MFIDGRDKQNTPKPQRREAGKRDCFSLQRSVMSIAGRHVVHRTALQRGESCL